MLEEDEEGLDCQSCHFHANKFLAQKPEIDHEDGSLDFKNRNFKIGQGVMLVPNSFNLLIRQKKGFRKAKTVIDRDPNVYTEYWRKYNKGIDGRIKGVKGTKGNTEKLTDPFDIGIITKIVKASKSEVKIEVRN